MKVLVVDDDPLCQMMLRPLLEKEGHQVWVAGSGELGWEEFQREGFPVVICDWSLPGLSGLDFCRRIREGEREAGEGYTYFILITASVASRGNYEEAMAAQVDDFLNKPLNFNDIRMRLHVASRILKLDTQVRELQRLMSICMYCHKVKMEDGRWIRVEELLRRLMKGTSFSHGVCEVCQPGVLARMEASFAGDGEAEPESLGMAEEEMICGRTFFDAESGREIYRDKGPMLSIGDVFSWGDGSVTVLRLHMPYSGLLNLYCRTD